MDVWSQFDTERKFSSKMFEQLDRLAVDR